MNKLLEKCLETISSISDTNYLIYDWEYSTYCVKFKKNGLWYEFKFCRRFFGIISEIYLVGNDVISDDFINKNEFKLLKRSFNDRIDSINQSKLNDVFPDIERNNKLNQILN